MLHPLTQTRRRLPTPEQDRQPTAAPWTLARRAAIEGIGTAFLLATIVGSGIMGDRLSGGNPWQTLLANSLATGAVLVALITAFAPLSGAHFNPIVTLVEASLGPHSWKDVLAYLPAQTAGAFAGVAAAHVMFGEPLFSVSHRARGGVALIFAELIATMGLLAVVLTSSRSGGRNAALAVGSYIAAAYWFTSSTSFANPAVTLARSVTDTFAGIRPADVPGFVIAALAAATGVALLSRWLIRRAPSGSEPSGD